MFNRTSSVGDAFEKVLLAGILWVVVLAPYNGAAATFQGLPAGMTLARGISGDGSVVVGSGVGSRAFRWTVATGVVDDLGTLPGDSTASAFAASADGSVVVGQSCDNTNTSCRAFRWTAASGMVSLGRLPGDNTAEGIAVSADGSVVVGPSCAAVCHAFRWTVATGMVDIGMLPGDSAAFPLAVSGDGAVVVGQSNVSGVSSHAFRWTMATGMVNLGVLPGDVLAQATGVNFDGSVVVGFSNQFNMPAHAFRWTTGAGMANIGILSGDTIARSMGVNAEGSVVVGISSGATSHAFRWTAPTGMQPVQALLTQAGVDLGGWVLNAGIGVSADGNSLIGGGTDPKGKGDGWFASLTAGACAPLPAETVLVAAVLPSSRSVQVGAIPATAYATILNAGANLACGAAIARATDIPATFKFNTTDCNTNLPTGPDNVAVNIPAGGSACFLLTIIPTASFPPTETAFTFSASNATAVAPLVGINTLLLSASFNPVPDIVALAATLTKDSIVHVPGPTGAAPFAVATVNVGASAVITASVDTGSALLPLSIFLCQTTSVGACMAPPTTTVAVQINAGDTPTFGIFVNASGNISLDPANSRVFVVFTDAAGVIRGRTSVAVETQ